MKTPGQRSPVEERERRIRDLVNIRRRLAKIYQDYPRFTELCSAMDALGDTELALRAYRAGECGSGPGAQYIVVYGVLQTLFVQQDATKSLYRGLCIHWSDFSDALRKIREIRNLAVGHPTRKAHQQPVPSSNFICRVTMSPREFQLMSCFEDGRNEFHTINLTEFLQTQEVEIVGLLDTLIENLGREENAYMKKWKGRTLNECFTTTGYLLGKVSDFLHGGGDAQLTSKMLELIADEVDRFRKELVEREITPEADRLIHDQLDRLTYPIAELAAFAEGREGENGQLVDARSALIYASHLRNEIDSLKQYAKGIDSELAERATA